MEIVNTVGRLIRDGDAMEQPDVTTTHLVHLVAHHDVGQLLDLPAGWRVWRQPDGSWLRSTVEPQ